MGVVQENGQEEDVQGGLDKENKNKEEEVRLRIGASIGVGVKRLLT